MKKSIFILALSVIMLFPSFSQGIRFGVFAEPKFNWLSPDVSEFSNDGTRMGFNFGLIMDNYFTENYAFATGISMNYVGGNLLLNSAYKIEDNSGDTLDLVQDSRLTYRLQYVNIPLGLKLKTNPIGFISFTSNVGLTPQINIKGLLEYEAEDGNKLKENISNEFNLFNLGYHIGVGMEYNIGGNSAITASIIYTNGFLDLTKDEKDSIEDNITMNNVALKLGIMF